MLVDNFNTAIDIWITGLQDYNSHDLYTKPDPESWSIEQVFTHLINETNYYIEQIESCLRNNENVSEEMSEDAKIIFSKNEFPDEKIKGDPYISENIQQPVSKSQLQKEMQELKFKMNRLWTILIKTVSNGKTKHSGLAYFNAQEWFQYAGMHLRHHLRQKQRIDNFLNSRV